MSPSTTSGDDVRNRFLQLTGRVGFERLAISVPEELHAMWARLGFDFGKFDYVVRDGQIVLLDANRTPT